MRDNSKNIKQKYFKKIKTATPHLKYGTCEHQFVKVSFNKISKVHCVSNNYDKVKDDGSEVEARCCLNNNALKLIAYTCEPHTDLTFDCKY